MGRQFLTITVTGEMDPVLREQFEDLDVTTDRGVTRLRVASRDPSILNGVLRRLDLLGLELIDLRTIDDV